MEIHKLDSYDSQFIQSLIDNEIEESIHIEFKRAESLSKKDAVKKEISKDISAFANSDGGIIIYGLEEKNHKASNHSFINGSIFTKEWLEQVISSTIYRTIQNIKIYPIRYDSNIEKTIYVVQIPSSIDAPHMSKGKRFYRRHNFESTMMEEYEIRQLYGRKLKSELTIGGYRIGKLTEQDDDDKIKYQFEVLVKNEGEILEKDYKINVYFDNMVKGVNIYWPDYGINRDYHFTNMGNAKNKMSSIGKPIYPSEMITVLNFNFKINLTVLEKAKKEMKFRIMLFYSNGDQIIEVDFGKLNNKPKLLEQLEEE